MDKPAIAMEAILVNVRYVQPELVRQHVMEVWLHDEYKALKPMGKTHTHNNGEEAFLMTLVGTIPIVFKEEIYHIPVEIVVCESFCS